MRREGAEMHLAWEEILQHKSSILHDVTILKFESSKKNYFHFNNTEFRKVTK